MLEVEAKAKTATEAATAFAEAFKKKTGVAVDVKSDKINGLTSSRVSFVQYGNNKKVTYTSAWIEYGGLIYRMVGGASPGYESIVTSNLESFASITETERRGVTKKIIRVVEANKGETIQSVSKRNNNLINSKLTAAINGVTEETVFQQGDLLKIVVEVAY
jgi:predicted Zn-dependent protease